MATSPPPNGKVVGSRPFMIVFLMKGKATLPNPEKTQKTSSNA